MPKHTDTPDTTPTLNTHTQSTSYTRQFRHAYGPRSPVRLTFPEQGREKQSFKDECDINNIMRRFNLTGELPRGSGRPAFYGEVPDIDFQGAMQIVIKAEADFMSLPAQVRDRFANNPASLIEFLQDENNRDEAIRLGLLRVPEPQAIDGKSTPPAEGSK